MRDFKRPFLVFSAILIHHVSSQEIFPNSFLDLLQSDLNLNSSLDSILPQISGFSLLPGLRSIPFLDIAARNGYTAETHLVTTEDGYILTLYRIRGNRRALPVLLFHGVGDAAETWIVRDDISLGVTLVRRNYDVWFGNARGNRHSRGHTFLDPDVDRAYWNFSFHEHGVYDLPATIDYILNNTGAEKLNMFGHSQGNTIAWVLLSTKPEYNRKINVATALAPICYLHNVPPPLGILIRIAPPLYPFLTSIGLTNLFGDNSIQTTVFRVITRIPVIGYLIGTGLLFSLSGYDYEELEPSFLRAVSLQFPTWTSLKNLVHFAQVGSRKIFARFDYGSVQNQVVYNMSTPPTYDLSKVRTKVVLLAARNDKLSTIPDVEILRRQLPNVVQYVVNPRLLMNHDDYTWGRHAPDYLFKYIFNVLDRYN